MKILLIRPPDINSSIYDNVSLHPIEILYVAAYLFEGGFETSILDLEVESFDKETFSEKIRSLSPDIILFYSKTDNIISTHFFASYAKDIKKSIITIISGNHISSLPERSMKEFPYFDFGIVGEIEPVLLQFCSLLSKEKDTSNIEGLVYRDKAKIVNNLKKEVYENPNQLPMPARDLINVDKYKPNPIFGVFKNPISTTPIITSRGISKNNLFGFETGIFSSKRVFRSSKNIYKEITESKFRYGFNYFSILDNSVSCKKVRFLEICQVMKKAEVFWDFKVSIDNLDYEMSQTAIDSGCLKVVFEVDSDIYKNFNKEESSCSTKELMKCLKVFNKAKVFTHVKYLLGSNFINKLDDINDIVSFSKNLNFDHTTVHFAPPIPGSALFEDLNKSGKIFDGDWTNYNFVENEPFFELENIKSKDLIRAKLLLYRNTCFNFRFLLKYLLNFNYKFDFKLKNFVKLYREINLLKSFLK